MKKPLFAMLVLVAIAAGCSKSDKTVPTGAPGGKKAPAATVAEPVAAVLQSTGTPIAKLVFVLAAAPVLGQPVALRLDISSAVPVPALQLVAEGDGVAIDAGTAKAGISLQTAGATVSHSLKLTPQREGLAEVTLRLTDGSAESMETVYVIPVLVPAAATGQGTPKG